MRILLTNDDGIQAIGIQAMHRALTDAGHAVQVVAPVTEQSAVGHAVTMSAPLRVREFADGQFRGYGVQGTPVDCVKLALATLLRETPDLVVSGINAGANVGVDILYSGTVAAATDAALMGFPALAVSYDGFNPTDLSEQAAYAARLIPQLPWPDLPPQCVLNLNFPAVPLERAAPLACCPRPAPPTTTGSRSAPIRGAEPTTGWSGPSRPPVWGQERIGICSPGGISPSRPCGLTSPIQEHWLCSAVGSDPLPTLASLMEDRVRLQNWASRSETPGNKR